MLRKITKIFVFSLLAIFAWGAAHIIRMEKGKHSVEIDLENFSNTVQADIPAPSCTTPAPSCTTPAPSCTTYDTTGATAAGSGGGSCTDI